MKRPQTTLLFLSAFGLATALAACASAGGSSDGSPRRDPNMITAEELVDFSTTNALDAIRRLRPRWLQGRGNLRPMVVVDGARMDNLEDALQSIQAASVRTMRYMSATDATMRFGTNFLGGAIEVTTRGG
ncbi:MAG: hypothetical protein OXF01_16585 [Gemmatimonadetes bacterium]|nr:hypothetical protein [Gemmatimonadota bacterium]